MANSTPLSPVALPSADIGNVHDLRSLNNLRSLAKHDEKAALKAAAEQFESVMLQQMLQSMRDANEVFEDDEFFGGGNHLDLYEQMHDEQLAVSMARSQSLGLAELMVQQLTRNSATARDDSGVGDSKAVQTGAGLPPAIPVRPPLAAAGNVEPPTPAAFVQAVWPYAEQAGKDLGVDPKMLVAQAALESGWGVKLPVSVNGASSHQYFGIKADARWQGERVSASTLEFRAGVPQRERAEFRAYDSAGSAFADYVAFLRESPRYADALKQAADPAAFARGLQQAGYATDPGYARKLLGLFNSEKLTTLVQEARNLLR